MRRLFYLLFLLFLIFSRGTKAQQDTVFYSFYITNPCNGNTHQFNDGYFLEGQSLEVESQDLSELDTALSVYQNLYDALVGSTFGLEDGAIDVDIEIGIWLLQLECGSDTIVDPTGRGIPHFLFWGVIVKEEGDTTVYGFDDFYTFKNNKTAYLKIPSTAGFLNYLSARGIDLDSLAFVYYQGDSVVTSGISWTQIPPGS